MRIAAAAMSALCLASGYAQQADQRAVFSSRVDVVRVDALVTRGGQPVRGLTPADFEIRDNGVLQHVDYVGLDEVPLNVVLAFDMSGSVAGARLDHLRSASRAVFDALKPADRGAVVRFGYAVVPSAALSSNVTELRAVLDHGDASGQTTLIDGCYAGLMLGVSDTGRSMLLIFSDGLDTASWLTAASVIDTAKRGDVVAYGVVVAGGPKLSFLHDLTSVTGGDLVEIKTTTDLNAVFLRLLNEYRQRYLLSYVPRGVGKGGWHQLDVRVKSQGATVKARPGYLGGS
jgi:VWFA-related protein